MYRNSKSNWRQPTPQRFSNPNRVPLYAPQNSRTPLYPIGPSIQETHKYTPIYGGPNFPRPNSPPGPFVNIQKQQFLQQPSYYQSRSSMRPQQDRTSQNPNFQQRQKKLLALNQAQIQGQARRRQALRLSYERQIQRITLVLGKNQQRKEKLKSEIQILTADGQQLSQKLSEYKPPQSQQLNLSSSLQSKQQQLLRLKTQLMTQMRNQQENLLKQRQQQESEWQNRLQQKQKILLQTQQRRTFAHTELLKARLASSSPSQPLRLLQCTVEDAVRTKKYQQYSYDINVLLQKINSMQLQRQQSTRELKEQQYQKIGQIKDQIIKISKNRRQKLQLQQNILELSNRNAEIQRANQNLQQQDSRKYQLVQLYETDLTDLKYATNKNETLWSTYIDDFRNRRLEDEGSGGGFNVQQDIQKVQRAIREVQSENFRLKADFQKLNELLNSSISKSIYQTFNELHFT